jgi:hypothetical protein
LCNHQVDRFFRAQRCLGRIRKLAKRRSGAIEHTLPADFFAPPLNFGARDAGGLEIVEFVTYTVCVEPRPRFFNRISVPDPIKFNRQRCNSSCLTI